MMVETAERVYKNSRHRHDDIKVSELVFFCPLGFCIQGRLLQPQPVCLQLGMGQLVEEACKEASAALQQAALQACWHCKACRSIEARYVTTS